MKKYFDIFKLDDSASLEDLEQAYQELRNAWRPENYQNLPRYRRKAETKLTEINDAYARLKSYLAAKPQPVAQNKRAAPEAAPHKIEPDSQPTDAGQEPQPLSERSPDSEPAPTPDRPADMPPWEPERPARAAAVVSRPHIHRTAQKSLIFGFIAILAVLGVLFFLRSFNRPTPPEGQLQTPVAEKAQPTAATARKPSAAERTAKVQPQEALKTEAAKPRPAPESAQSQPTTQASIQKQPEPIAAQGPDRVNYQKVLSEEALNFYNRNPARVRRIQKSLIANGYDTGPVDGIIGPFTSAALQQFAGDHQIGADNLFAPDLAGAVVLYAEVAARHPNWHQIIASDEFTRWLDSQTYYGADRLQTLKESATPRQVNDIIELYKLERNMQPD